MAKAVAYTILGLAFAGPIVGTGMALWTNNGNWLWAFATLVIFLS